MHCRCAWQPASGKQRVLLGENELTRVDVNVVKVADQHGDESAEGVAKVVVLARVEDAEGVERASSYPANRRESTRK